ncbi:unnamed protein product [Cladocopium goreaui]|uniref:RNase H type-1 domain-containing protein n=1 Tax=Cladocopium goreaui TaxID=2562237 RepID=A0A9P1DRL3_9DINO|nr:unnamed protein product [Cladocopium goreaui]
MRSPQAHYCDLCGQAWQDCIQYPSKNASRRGQTDYYSGYTQEYEETPWAGPAWRESPRNSPRKSPRQPSGRRTKQKPQKGQGKGTSKGKEKGNFAMASQAQQTAAPPPPPPLTGPNAAPAPWMSMPQPPQEVQAQEHPAEQRLNEVMNLLKKKKGDQDIQEIVNKYDSFGKKATKKQMHHAVNDLDRARNAMEDAIQARTNLMNNWRSFLTASLDRWREYTGQFQQQEAKCQEEIAKAKEDLAKAKVEFLARMPDETQEISDEDVDIKEQSEAASKILGGMENMNSNLLALTEQAAKDKAEAEERSNKRPRKTASGSAAMETDAGSNDVILQEWNHSIVQKWWFISTWEASERALALHWEVCEDTPHCPPVPRWQGLGLAMPKRRDQKERRVRFANFAEGLFEDQFGDTWNRFDLSHGDDCQQVGPQPHPTGSKKPLGAGAFPLWNPSCLNTSSQHPLHQHRINDEWHNVPSQWLTQDGLPQDQVPGDEHFNLNEAPNTIQELFNTFLEHHLVEGPRLSEAIHLRTWYLHHAHVRQWNTPRIIELDGHWRHWARDIAEGWRDHVRLDEDIAFHVCHPDPPRNVGAQWEISFDLILAQGLDMPSWSGLITVLRVGDRASRAEYSLAAAAAAPEAETATGDVQMDYEPEEQQHEGFQDHDNDEPPDAESSSSDLPHELQAVHIFRLGHWPNFGHIDWRSYHAALRDAAQLVRAHINHFVGFHYVHVSLVGHQAGEEAIILQHVNDIALGSLEKLVIVDTVLHTNRLNQGVPDNPAVTREVYKVQPQLARRHLLLMAQVDAYCTWMADTCIVEHNGHIWHRNDPQLRQVEHGAVFRIQLPPPLNPAWNIGQAVRVAHETGEILDFPEAGQLAHSILDGNVEHNRLDFGEVARDGARLVTCKGNDQVEATDIPTTFPPGTRMPRLRPRHDGKFDWLDQLVDIFRANAEAETIEGDPLLYIQTWYIHHQRLRRCPDPRPLRLDNAIIGWVEELRFAWRDLLDRHIDFSIHVVSPRPPQLRFQDYACHVILVQAPQLHRAAGIITNLFEGPDRDAIQQFALSFPKRINKPTVIDELRLQPQCDTRRCTIHACGELVHLILITELPEGFNLCTRISDPTLQRPIPPLAETEHFEDVIFMQSGQPQTSLTTATSASASSMPNTVCGPFIFNADAPPFVPGILPIEAMSEFVQDLHDLWLQEAFNWEDEEKSCTFTTWLAHHPNDYKHCTRPRNVRLYESFAMWEQTIRQTWQDEIEADSDLEFHLVSPTPPHLGEHLLLEDVLEIVGYGGACIPHNEERHDEIATVAVQLLRGHDDIGPLPSFVEIVAPATVESVQEELSCFGIQCQVSLLGHGNHALCLPTDWVPDHEEHHLAYVDMSAPSSSDVLLHTVKKLEKERTLDHMRFLYGLGFEKAVIMQEIEHFRGLVEVQFMVSVGHLEFDSRPPKPASTWPSRQPQINDGPMYEVPSTSSTPACLLALGVTSDQLLEFFSHSQDQVLCQLIDGFDFPEVVQQHLQRLSPIDHVDRIIIYTDGSSHSGRYHLAPELVEEQHIPDAWAFVALGEQYHDDGSTYTLLGWKAHQVRCAEDHPWHIGSRAIGPWVAEREAMIWAFLWRIGLNRRTPTLFRSDSSLTIGQAEGTLGPRETWMHPNGRASHQIDFVMVPTHMATSCTFSSLLETFDLGNQVEDHTATALELHWSQLLSRPLKATPFSEKPTFARERIKQANLRSGLMSLSTSVWTCDVETHTSHMNNQLHHLLHRSCPLPKGTPKRSYVSDDAWDWRRQKLHHRKAMKTARALLRRETLARIFAAWRAPSAQLLELSFVFGSTLRCGLFKHYIGFRRSAAALQRDLAAAKSRHLHETLATIDEGTAASEIQHKLKGFMGSSNKLRQGLAPLPALRNAHNLPCERVPFSQLHAEWVRQLQDFSETAQVLSISDLPSLSALEASCRRVKAGKADGPDAIPTELCKFYPVETARMMYALMMKLVTHGHEPLLHKGGTVIPIWKGKLAKDTCEAYRSILLSSTLGKVVHRTLRIHQKDIYEAYLHSQQLGGRCHVPVTLGAHQTRAFVRWHRDCGHPTAVLFVDLQEAFYRVLRQLALPGSFEDEALAKLAQRLGLGPDILHELWKHLQEPCALDRAGMPACAQRVVRALHSNTHFQIPQQDDHVQTKLGTRPGDAYADIVFGFLLARVLHSYEEQLAQAQVLSSVPSQEGMELFNVEVQQNAEMCRFLGPVWMDDMALCLWSETNAGLKAKIGVATSILLDIFREHAMTPNLRPGKTELMVSPRGPGTRAWKKEMFGPLSTKHFPAIGEHGLYHVHLVTSYTHLGGVIHYTGEVRAEVRRRVAIAHQAFSKHRKLVYQCRAFSLHKRAEIFRSLILSRLLYGADSWALWDSHSKMKLHSAIMKLYRRLLGSAHNAHMQDDEILWRVGLSSPTDLLRLCRLRYIGSLCAIGHTACWGLLNKADLSILLQMHLHLDACFVSDDADQGVVKIQPIRHYIAGTQCGACLKEYHTAGQIQQHLLRSADCRTYLLHHRLQGNVLPGIGSREDALRRQEHDGRLPPLQASGPTKPWRGGLDFSLIDFDLHDALALVIVDAQTNPDIAGLEVCLRAEILRWPTSWTRCRATLGELADTVLHEQLGWEALSRDDVLALLHRLSTTSSWPFLVDEQVPDETYMDTLENMEKDCREETLSCPPAGTPSVPRMCGRHQIVLHAFSGRRRPGDLQFYMEQMYDRAAEGIHLTVVSLDIVTDPVLGDVTVQETQDFWFHHASCGAVAGFLCGPPCETWSRARFVAMLKTTSQRRSPRPVRSGEDLWGLCSLSLREARQVGVGNLLLCFALEMLFRLALVGASGVLEHPDTPPDESMPSIWRLPIMLWLLQMPGMSTFSFSQGLLGAPTPKPTRLLVLNMCDLMGELRRHHLCRDLPARAAIGRDEDGAWQTSKLKEYPPAMSRALASSFVRTLSACQFEETVQLDEAFVKKCAAMDTKSFGTKIGMDFAGQS